MPALIQQESFMAIESQKTSKVTKVRRTRQPRNPQLSVARRNERERNRVKMVNNGFAMLREHLPIEDLQASMGGDSDGTETPDLTGGKRAKKFSKVETLRAAIARIRMLEELIRSTEPGFESMNICQTKSNNYDDEQPLSVGEPLSCGSASDARSNSTSGLTISHQNYQQQQYPQQMMYATGAPAGEQFVKLEPQLNQHQPIPSPQGSQHSSHHGLPSQINNTTSQQQYPTQVHQSAQLDSQPSHTHLWIQQHQSSFMEQQQMQMHQQPAQYQQHPTQTYWYQDQQQQQQQQQQQTLINLQPASQLTNNLQSPGSQQSSHPQQMDSPVWFNSGSPASVQSQSSQPVAFHHQHQQHQISLYSQ